MTFFALNVVVPDNLIFLVSVMNVVNADLRLTLFDTPAPGSSNHALIVTAVGNTASSTASDRGLGNVNVSLDADAGTAIPEPAVFAVIGSALAGLAWFRRGRSRSGFVSEKVR